MATHINSESNSAGIGAGEPKPQIAARMASTALAMEEAIRAVRHVLAAIDHGGLLDVLPADPVEADRHNVATGLLAMLHPLLEATVNYREADVSTYLSTMAKAA